MRAQHEPRASVRGLPERLEVGAGTALRLDGTAERGLRPLRVRLGEASAHVEWGPAGGELVWWCVLPLGSDTAEGERELRLVVEDGEGERELLLGETIVSSHPAPAEGGRSAPKPRIAICMATYEPRREWLLRQLDSIREQSLTEWVCVISDDASSPEAFATLEGAVADDPRFIVSRSERNLGFYANFERALAMAPPDVEFVALCDQDDRWDPDKLETLAAALAADPAAQLVYSDMRVVSEEGELLSPTFWYLTDNGWDDIVSMAIVNTVTGAASLFRRELLDVALPFPPAGTPEHYHDHWLALCALARGEIDYVDRPTYDYTRHLRSVTLTQRPEALAPSPTRLGLARAKLRRWVRRVRLGLQPLGWGEVYRERYLMIVQYATVLELRAGTTMDDERRRDLRRLAGAERSVADAAWLLGRALLRPLRGRREAQGRDRVVLGALIWRAVTVRRARRG